MAEKTKTQESTDPKPALAAAKPSLAEEILTAGGWTKSGDCWVHHKWFDYRNAAGQLVHVPDNCRCPEEEALTIESQRKK
jgi:hypothetical protein